MKTRKGTLLAENTAYAAVWMPEEVSVFTRPPLYAHDRGGCSNSDTVEKEEEELWVILSKCNVLPATLGWGSHQGWARDRRMMCCPDASQEASGDRAELC